ncbi:MAG: valS, partial [Chloroflexi bacterium]|nr:valS [Chloroflexota bacterium]
ANETTAHVTRLLEDFQFGEAARTVHDFVWNEFCDWYVEIAKIEMREAASAEEASAVRMNLAWVFEHTLRLLHPMIVIAPWPVASEERDADAESRMEQLMDVVRGVRNLRAEYHVDPARLVPATIVAGEDVAFFQRVAPLVGGLPGCRLSPVEILARVDAAPDHAATVVIGGVTLYVPLAGMVDVAQERVRLDRERADALAEVERAEALLGRPGFVEKARPDVVQRERDKLVGLRDRLSTLTDRLAALA